MKIFGAKFVVAGLIILAACTVRSTVMVGAEEMVPAQTRAVLPTGLEIGGGIYYYKYEEPNFAATEGFFYGMSSSYIYRPLSLPIAVRGELDLGWGILDYSSNGTGTADSNDNFVAEPRVWLGYDIPAWGGYLTPYFGVGYRYLENNMGGVISTTGAAGYDRISQYIYSPLGIEYWLPLQNNWTMAYTLEYDFFWDGTQESQLSDVTRGLSDLTNDQNGGFGVRTSVRLTTQAAGYTIDIEPFFRYWLINDSDVLAIRFQGVAVGYGLEPENQTFEAGVKILLKY